MLPPPPAHPGLRRCPSLNIIDGSRPQATRSPSVGGASPFPPRGITRAIYISNFNQIRSEIMIFEGYNWPHCKLMTSSSVNDIIATIYWFISDRMQPFRFINRKNCVKNCYPKIVGGGLVFPKPGCFYFFIQQHLFIFQNVFSKKKVENFFHWS